MVKNRHLLGRIIDGVRRPLTRVSVKLVLSVCFVLAVEAVVLGLYMGRSERRVSQQRLLEIGKTLAHHFAIEAEYGVMIRSEDELRGLIPSFLENEDFVYLSICDAECKELIFAKGRASGDLDSGDVGHGHDELPRETRVVVKEDKTTGKEYFEIVEPIRISSDVAGLDELSASATACTEGQIIGLLKVGVSPARIKREIAQAHWRVFYITLLVTAVCGFGVWFISRRLVRPIGAIVKATGHVGEGRFDYKVDVGRRTDELGTLANAFNRMTENLTKTTASRDELAREVAERERVEKELRRSYQIQGIINKLLRLSQEDISMEEMLQKTIDYTTSIPGLGLESKGAVFLVEDEPEVLVMKAQRGLAAVLQTTCSRDPFGRCLCGRAAMSGEIVFADCVDERHETRYEGIASHGHYCVPIISAGGRVVGVFNLYVRQGHIRDEREEEFLRAVASILAPITERKRAEDALRRSQEHLRDANEELERSNRDMQDFTYAVSHDLQEPLRKIHTFSQFFIEDCGHEISEKGRDYLSRMRDAVGRMSTLIRDLLALSRVGTRGGQPELVNPNDIVKEVLDTLSVKLAETGAEVEVGPLPTVMADKTQLGQLFQNLIGNALKFRAPDRPLKVTVSADVDGEFATFSIADNGIGIEERFLEKIFAIFQRLHTRDQYEGTGVGLATCKKIVGRHGGKIWAESEPGKGSSFRFTMRKASESAVPAAGGAPQQSTEAEEENEDKT